VLRIKAVTMNDWKCSALAAEGGRVPDLANMLAGPF
jgi:hypothetical protein